MTADRWTRVERLFHEALEQPVGERAAFLGNACDDDDDLRRDVESLLDEYASDDGFLGQPPAILAQHLSAVTTPQAMTGRLLGVYRLEALLGAGGMGDVYRARDTRLGRDVAIKILPAAFTANPDRLARFAREARMLAAVSHPNICSIYGMDVADGVHFLILELAEGNTLASRIGSGLGLVEALAIARQIAEALEVAHERGIVHRDLKPANVCVTPNGFVKVLDFGLAKPVGPEAPSTDLSRAPNQSVIERGGALIGTAAYMSPEQARGQAVDKRTDIWAFGCVLFEMLSGRSPFGGDTASDSIARVLEREPEWSSLPAGIPAAVRRLLQRCLAKDSKQRLRDIGDARLELDSLSQGQAEKPEPVRRSLPASSAVLVAALVLAAVVLAAVAGLAILNTPAPTGADLFATSQFSALTDWEGTEALAEISPDGRFVAFLSDRAGELDIWWTQIGTGVFRNLTENLPALDNPGVLRTFGFSGDGAGIWFGAIGRPNQLMPQIGGAPRPFLSADAKALAWSPDGNQIAYFTLNDGRDLLSIADRTGAEARRVAITPADVSDWSGVADSRAHTHNPAWSPDNQWLYFVHGVVRDWNDSSDEMDIWRIPASGGRPERLTHAAAAITFIAPVDARTLLYIAPDLDGSGSWLWSFDLESRTARRLISGLEQFTSISISRDGRRMVATRANPAASLWTVPISDRAPTEAQPYAPAIGRALAPRFGGGSLFYRSARGAADGLWRLIDGRPEEIQKGADGILLQAPAPSPDGRRVAVVRKGEARHLLTIMSADGTNSRTVATSLHAHGTPDWSQNGRWLVTGGSDSSGREGLFRIDVDGESSAEPVRLATGEANNPVWSPDGELIVYTGPFAKGQAPLFAVRPDGTPVDFPALRVSPGGYRFMHDGAGLIYLPRPESLDFWLLDFASKKSRQLTQLDQPGTIRRFDITPDGTQIVFDRLRPNSDIVVIDVPGK